MSSKQSAIIDTGSRDPRRLTALRGCATIITGNGGAALQCQRSSGGPRLPITRRTSI
jgi:hypothetical protein